MLRNYIKIALRNIQKRKLHSILNISGLALGIASFIIISLYILNELRYDRYHEKADRIYRIGEISDFGGVGENSASLPFPVAFTLKGEYPDLIEEIVRIFNFQTPRSMVEYEEKRFIEKGFFFADSTFFKVFTYEFIKGNAETALDESYSVVITESTAEKYFGAEDPYGKVLKFESSFPLKVTGVIKDIPAQSHFHFDFIASMTSVYKIYGGKLPSTWVWNPCWTYFVLQENATPKQVEEKFPEFVNKFFYDAEKDNVTLHLQLLTDIHLNSLIDYEIESNNNIVYIYILGGIGIFLLIIAIINFINLSTATYASRAKEIGMKKVVGAYRTQLIVQFIGESIILTLIALVIGLIIVEITLPFFNSFTHKDIGLDVLLHTTNILALVAMVLGISLLSGLYPAIYLSKVSPIASLKDNIGAHNRSGLARKILVVAQFTISIGLIICTLIIFKQINYLKKADLGFNKENIIVIPVGRTSIVKKYKVFRDELVKHPSVISVTAKDDIFGSGHNTHEFRPDGFPDNEWQFYPALVVQYDFVKTFGIKLVAGRDYNELNKTDPIKGILINEAMVKHLGWESNEAAIGKRFRSLEGDEKVIGVINNFHATSLHRSSGPFVINMKEAPGSIAWFLNYIALKIVDGSEKEVIEVLEKQWVEFAGNRPFEYFFLENELKRLYKDEENLGLLALVFTIMIIFIAGLGLYGLTSYMADKRTKEIGIRKVMGASGFSIIRLLSAEFVKLIIIANIVAWPLAWLVIRNWLSQFAYQTNYGVGMFVISGLIALILALAITGIKASMAARTNPVDTLKHE